MSRVRTAVAVAISVSAAAVTSVLAPANTPQAAAVSCTVTVRLHPSVTDDAVVCLEQRLIELGYPGIIGPDNTYDSVSVAAVQAFQTERGLFPDGRVTSITGRQLGLRGALPSASAARVTVIGDSTAAAMRWFDEAANASARYDVLGTSYDLLWAVESCRRLVNRSCGSRSDPSTGVRWTPPSVLPMMQTSLRGRLGDALVIMAGYDDTSIVNAIESIMAEATSQGVTRVFWLNYRLSTNYNAAYQGHYREHNATLEAAKARHPSLEVLDWNGYTYAQPVSTQQLWFSSDQIHLSGLGALALANFLKASIDPFNLAQCRALNANAGLPGGSGGGPPSPPTNQSGFHPIAPTRVLDTRAPSFGGGNGKMGAGHTITVDLTEQVPVDAAAAVLNVTAVDPCDRGYLVVFACGTQPGTSNVNYVAGRTTAGMAITGMTNRTVCLFASSRTDVVVDLVGAFVPTGALFHPAGPTRWIDTRGAPAMDPRIERLSGGSQFDVAIAGVGGVPIDATAVWINLTVTDSPTASVLQAYPGPCGTPPETSIVNVLPNRSAATAAIVQLGNGGICVRAFTGQAHVVIDVSGWFGGAAPGGRAFVGQFPVRVHDSRSGQHHLARSTRSLSAPEVAVYNIAALDSWGFGWVSAKPCGVGATSSVVNHATNENVANVATVSPGTGGTICFEVWATTHLIVDQVGTFVLV